ncbi:acyltransferase family protein, partial [Neotabrizicola sp. sgz301269]|uniref:acyltransferase family protein n=1 Tax=Neotabrizicola sp. sgz301269 TaxID=3276282 RepID=UPI0037706903
MSREASDAIRVARVLCIIFMTTVHVWPGASEVMGADVGPVLHAFYLVLIDYLGRGSVPLLSVVSGFLLTRSLGRKSSQEMIRSKAWALLVPMVIWSALVLVLVLARALILGDGADMPHGVMGWINALFSVTAPPANIPVAFLRDVFVSAVIGIIVIGIYRQMPVLAGILLLILIPAEVGTGGLLLLRPQILVFYTIGLVLGLQIGRMPEPPWGLILLVLGLDAALRHVFGLPGSGETGIGLWMSYLGRIAMSLLMWRCALDIRYAQGGLWR